MKKVLLILLICNLTYSVWLHSLPNTDTAFHYLYNISSSLSFAIATITSFSLAFSCKPHRFFHITLGLGSLSYFSAQLMWAYYNLILQVNIPYPGLSDILFLIFYFFVIIAGISIMKNSIHVKFNLVTILEILLITFIIFVIISSFINSISPLANESLLIQILGYTYPLFDSLLVVLALSAVRSEYGRVHPLLLYFMFGFLILAFADIIFTYQQALDTYWNGNTADILFTIFGFLFGMGVVELPKILHAQDRNLSPHQFIS